MRLRQPEGAVGEGFTPEPLPRKDRAFGEDLAIVPAPDFGMVLADKGVSGVSTRGDPAKHFIKSDIGPETRPLGFFLDDQR